MKLHLPSLLSARILTQVDLAVHLLDNLHAASIATKMFHEILRILRWKETFDAKVQQLPPTVQ